ncbi:MAG: metalloendopeptidase, partial [Pseudomonadota bacterium]
MLGRAIVWPALCGAALVAFLLATPYGGAQSDVAVLTAEEAEAQLERATQASADAQARASRLASEAEEAEEAAVRTAREAAALAAQIQVAQADIVASRARFSLAQVERARLAQRLADRQQPLARLTAALQINARRPLALSALQPGSLKDLVYVRAVLDSAVPQIRDRTATLRDDLDRGRDLERRARRALANLRANEQELRDR